MSHTYNMKLVWTGNTGEGTSTYRAYERSYTIAIDGKQDVTGSSDPAFRGDKTKHNPEEMLVMALSSCHLLSYLHLCATNGIIVTSYQDNATGTMVEDKVKGGYFTEVMLNINMTVSDVEKKQFALELHHDANKLCFIANSVNFPVKHNVTISHL